MADTIIVYNQPQQKLTNLHVPLHSKSVDLTEIGLSKSEEIGSLVHEDTFALSCSEKGWNSLTYMEWEDLRINEALQEVKNQYDSKTQKILTSFVAGMDVKYQGKKSWTELLTQLAKEIEAK